MLHYTVLGTFTTLLALYSHDIVAAMLQASK